jgi:hypothetical protein
MLVLDLQSSEAERAQVAVVCMGDCNEALYNFDQGARKSI